MKKLNIFAAQNYTRIFMISKQTQQMIPLIKEYFAAKPIKKAWLFGSCSRGEDKPDSDVDLIVVYDDKAHVSLLTIGGIYMGLKELLGREIDLVEEGTLLPYAVETAERDKILIYERA